MSESKNWVTIAIPEETRDKAKEDSRAYWEIIEDGLTQTHTHTTDSDIDIDKIVERLKNELSMANEPTVDVDVEGLYTEIEKLQELVEQQPDRTAEKFEQKYR